MKNNTTKFLLFCGIIGPLLFVITFLIEGATRGGDYNPLRHPVSSLSIGEFGWMQMCNFIVTGSLFIAFALGMRQAIHPLIGSIVIGLVGMGLIGAGFCTSDPVYGYPTNLPMALAQFTIRGHLHDFFSIFVFVCLPIACFKFRRKFAAEAEKGWAMYSLITAIAMLVFFILAGAAFKQTPGILEYAGVFQRLSIMVGFGWVMMLAGKLRRVYV